MLDSINSKNSKIFEDCNPICKYCNQYKSKYVKILSSKPYWLTFNPPITGEIEPRLHYKYYMETYLQDILLSSDNFICITEFKYERMHFHIFLSRKDSVKYNIFVNKLMKCGITKSFKGEPLHGIHYLFKDIPDALEILEHIDFVINTDLTIKNDFLERKREVKIQKIILRERRKQEELKNNYKIFEPPTPKWMLQDEESESE